ncbi:MAG: cytochrome P450 [Ktedonobacteraceae bacterium]
MSPRIEEFRLFGGNPPMTTVSTLYPGFDYQDFRHRRQQQSSVFLTPEIFSWYQQMLQSHRVYFDASRASWLILGYDEVQRVMADTQTFSSQRELGPDGQNHPIDGLISLDPPRHRQVRTLISQAFTPRRIAQMEARITSIVHTLLDQVADQGEMDIVDDLALPLPSMVMADLLGCPPADGGRFQQWLAAVVGSDLALRHEAFASMHGYFQALIEQRQRSPHEDLVSALLQAEEDGERLPAGDVLGTCALLLLAGNETTTSLIGHAILCFDEHPEAWQQLLAQPSLLPTAIEEVLRCRPPIHLFGRVAVRDAVVAGQQIKAGELVVPVFAAANFDEAQFPNASTFDIRRTPNRHLSFGHGIHFCLGAPLGRLETRIALAALLERFPRLQRKRDVPLELKPSWLVYTIQHVPVTLG